MGIVENGRAHERLVVQTFQSAQAGWKPALQRAIAGPVCFPWWHFLCTFLRRKRAHCPVVRDAVTLPSNCRGRPMWR